MHFDCLAQIRSYARLINRSTNQPISQTKCIKQPAAAMQNTQLGGNKTVDPKKSLVYQDLVEPHICPLSAITSTALRGSNYIPPPPLPIDDEDIPPPAPVAEAELSLLLLMLLAPAPVPKGAEALICSILVTSGNTGGERSLYLCVPLWLWLCARPCRWPPYPLLLRSSFDFPFEFGIGAAAVAAEDEGGSTEVGDGRPSDPEP